MMAFYSDITGEALFEAARRGNPTCRRGMETTSISGRRLCFECNFSLRFGSPFEAPSLTATLAFFVIVAFLTAIGRAEPTAKPRHSSGWKCHTIDNSSLGADGVRSADVNADGLPDLVCGWEQGGVSRIYLMQREEGAHPSWLRIDAGPAPDVEDAFFVDLDRDGAIDVVSSTEGDNRKVLIHWAPSPSQKYTDSSLWKTETLFENGNRWMFAIAMDVDGRHGLDVIVGGKGPGAVIGWLQCPASARDLSAWKFHKLTDVTWTMSVICRDMNGDGLPDVLVSDRKGRREGVFWLRHPGKAHASQGHPWPKTWIADDLHEVNFIDTCDFDADGVEEILATSKQGRDVGRLSILRRQGDRMWKTLSVNIPPWITKPKAVQVGDINLDGQLDLILSAENAVDGRSGIIWLEHSDQWDNPDWTAHDISGPEGIKFDINLLLDLDDDGDLDVINTEENNNSQNGNAGLGLVWYENPVN